MAHAFSPGLKVLACTTVRRYRRLPLPGAVLVQQGERVRAEQVIMRTELPGPADMVNVVSTLGILPDEIEKYMVRRVGDAVKRGEVLAESKSFFGLFTTRVEAPMDGTVEAISKVTGQVTLRGAPVPVEVRAYVDGVVVEITPNEAVTVETTGAFVQGIFGVGGETYGTIRCVVNKPSDVLDAAAITPALAGAVVIGGGRVTIEALRAAVAHGVRAIVAGGIDDEDLKAFLGYDLGVAITGHEQLGLTLVITEGFGDIHMAERTFELLRGCEGKGASVNGATQIRAGVMRPEIIVPDPHATPVPCVPDAPAVLDVGTRVRAIRAPYFGRLGRVAKLIPELTTLPTESKARVLVMRFDDGTEALIPRANVEVIAEK